MLTPSGEEVAIASPTMSVTFNGNVRPRACSQHPHSIPPIYNTNRTAMQLLVFASAAAA